MFDENTGEEPKCVVCGSIEDCGHIVACLDLTFSECSCGALYDQDGEFLEEIETEFLKLLKTKTKTQWQNSLVEELWKQAQADYDAEAKDLRLDNNIFTRLLIELLKDAGATKYPGPVVDLAGPGLSSSYSLLYANKPDAVISKALKNLKSILS